MNTNKLKLATGLMCGLLLLPGLSHASSAIKLTDTTALFTIDFSFSEAPFDQTVPIAAKYGVAYQDRVDTVGYTIESTAASNPSAEVINALVLSRNPVAGTQYSVPEGTTGNFTLFILATFTEPITESLRASITKLPYFIDGRRTTVHENQLEELTKPVLEVKE